MRSDSCYILCITQKKYYPKKIYKHLYKTETIFMNSEKSETNESDKFSYHFTDITDKLNVKHPNKNISLVNLGIYYA